MYTDHLIAIEEHKAWFKNLQKSDTSLYLIFEIQERPVGLVYFTGIDKKNSKSYWGFYLGEEGLPHGSGTALGVLGLEFAFVHLGIRKLCGEVFFFNNSSIRFHEKLGFSEEGLFTKHVLKNGNYEDIISFALFKEVWEKKRDDLMKVAFL